MSDYRGTYRGIYCSLLDELDFQAMSSEARHTFLTLRLCSQNNAASIFRVYFGTLSEQTGYTKSRLEQCFQELQNGEWIVYQDGLVWIRNGLRYDPTMRLADPKHRKAVEKAVSALPRSELVLRFCEYYTITRPFDAPSEGITKKSEVGPPSPSPSPSPITESDIHKDPQRVHPVEEVKVLELLSTETGKQWTPGRAYGKFLRARLADGYTLDDLLDVVRFKLGKWLHNDDTRQYLNPTTLFRPENFERYLVESRNGRPKPTEQLPLDPKASWKSRESYTEARRAGRVHPSQWVPEWEPIPKSAAVSAANP